MGQLLCCDCFKDAQVESGTVDQAVFDNKAKSSQVKLSPDGSILSGTGCAVANSALHQDKCYFEVTLTKLPDENASFCIGVCHRSPAVVKNDVLGDLEQSWAFNAANSTEPFEEGDVISCLFDQSTGKPQLSFKRNNQDLPPSTIVKGFKGTVYPGASLDNGCELSFNFSIEGDGFKYRPPPGFSGLIPSRSLV
mmetsp:Transcript_19514/g.36073  ORF Transcript_19514/g.36073 Transcript_19514/m.36073 type:complete len:194 (+) Transcript_19514:45-626(+)